MNKNVTISVKIPIEVYEEIALRIAEGQRSEFLRTAIFEKLRSVPRANKILKLENRIQKIENDLASIKISLADLELLTFEKGRVNPHIFCIDKIDHDIIDYLIHYQGATTPEIAKTLNLNRWMILNRLKRIQRNSKKQLGKSIIEYFAGERIGKKKAWWLIREIADV